MVEEWKKTGSEMSYSGKRINLRRDAFILPDGKKHSSEIVEYADVSSVVAMKDGKLVLVRQFRPSINKITLEIPGGKIKRNEDPEEVAMRELEEETGYKTEALTKIGSVNPSVRLTNTAHLFFTQDLKKGNQNLDKSEFIDVIEVPVEDVMNHIDNGDITVATSVAGIMIAQRKGLI